MGAPALCEAGKMTAASTTPQPPPPTPSPPPPLSANMKQKHGPGRNADSHIRGVADAVIGVCLAVRDVEGAAVAPRVVRCHGAGPQPFPLSRSSLFTYDCTYSRKSSCCCFAAAAWLQTRACCTFIIKTPGPFFKLIACCFDSEIASSFSCHKVHHKDARIVSYY